MPRKRGRGKLSAPNGYTDSNLLADQSVGGGIQAKQPNSLEERVRDALRIKVSSGYHLDSAPGASMDSNSTPRSGMSENSRRSSASSAAALRDGDSMRPGKRKRRTDPSESVIDSNYSLRRRRSRIMPDSNGDYSQPLESPQESSNPRDPEMDYFNNELVNQMPEESIEVDRPTEAEDAEIPLIVEPRKRGKRGFRYHQETPPESALATPAPGTPMNGNDLGTGVNTDQEPSRMIRRLPGRRRAPNPNSSIEADLRRQLTLKTSFRSVVKALRPILLELSNRSIEQLEENEASYRECLEYDDIVEQLNGYLQERLAQVEAKYQLELNRIEDDLRNGQAYVHDEFSYQVEEIRDEFLHRALNGLAKVQYDSRREEDEDLTENEDEGASTMVAPTDSVIFARPGIGKSISRSHIFLGVERLGEVEELHDTTTLRINKAIAPIEAYLDEEIMELETGLGSMDLSRREEAIRLLNLHCLADAADAAEAADRATAAAVRRRSRRNEDHSGFDALLEASKMPPMSINGQEDSINQGRPLRSRVRTTKYRGQHDLEDPSIDEDQNLVKTQFTSQGFMPLPEPMEISYNLDHIDKAPPSIDAKRRINIGSLLSQEPEGYGSSSTDYEGPKKAFLADIPSPDDAAWVGDQVKQPGSTFINPFKGDSFKPITTLQPSAEFSVPRLQPPFPDVAQSIEEDPYERASFAPSHLDELQDPRLDQISLQGPRELLDPKISSPNLPKHAQFSTPLPPRLPPTSHVPPEPQSDELRSDYPFQLQTESRYQPFTRVQSTWQPPLWPYQQSSDPMSLPPIQSIQMRQHIPEEKFETSEHRQLDSQPISSDSTKWPNDENSSQPIGLGDDRQGHTQHDEQSFQNVPRLVKEESTGSIPIGEVKPEDELVEGNPNN